MLPVATSIENVFMVVIGLLPATVPGLRRGICHRLRGGSEPGDFALPARQNAEFYLSSLMEAHMNCPDAQPNGSTWSKPFLPDFLVALDR